MHHPNLQNPALATEPEVVGNQVAQSFRTERMQVEFARDGQLDGFHRSGFVHGVNVEMCWMLAKGGGIANLRASP